MTDLMTKSTATGATLRVALKYSKPALDRARYTLSRGEATPIDQRIASELLEDLIEAIRDT